MGERNWKRYGDYINKAEKLHSKYIYALSTYKSVYLDHGPNKIQLWKIITQSALQNQPETDFYYQPSGNMYSKIYDWVGVNDWMGTNGVQADDNLETILGFEKSLFELTQDDVKNINNGYENAPPYVTFGRELLAKRSFLENSARQLVDYLETKEGFLNDFAFQGYEDQIYIATILTYRLAETHHGRQFLADRFKDPHSLTFFNPWAFFNPPEVSNRSEKSSGVAILSGKERKKTDLFHETTGLLKGRHFGRLLAHLALQLYPGVIYYSKTLPNQDNRNDYQKNVVALYYGRVLSKYFTDDQIEKHASGWEADHAGKLRDIGTIPADKIAESNFTLADGLALALKFGDAAYKITENTGLLGFDTSSSNMAGSGWQAFKKNFGTPTVSLMKSIITVFNYGMTVHGASQEHDDFSVKELSNYTMTFYKQISDLSSLQEIQKTQKTQIYVKWDIDAVDKKFANEIKKTTPHKTVKWAERRLKSKISKETYERLKEKGYVTELLSGKISSTEITDMLETMGKLSPIIDTILLIQDLEAVESEFSQGDYDAAYAVTIGMLGGAATILSDIVATYGLGGVFATLNPYVLLVGLALNIGGFIWYVFADDSDIEIWLRHTYFGVDREETKRNWNYPNLPYYRFVEPDGDGGWVWNFGRQISEWRSMIHPLGFSCTPHMTKADYAINPAKNLPSQLSSKEKNAKLLIKPGGAIYIRPLPPKLATSFEDTQLSEELSRQLSASTLREWISRAGFSDEIPVIHKFTFNGNSEAPYIPKQQKASWHDHLSRFPFIYYDKHEDVFNMLVSSSQIERRTTYKVIKKVKAGFSADNLTPLKLEENGSQSGSGEEQFIDHYEFVVKHDSAQSGILLFGLPVDMMNEAWIEAIYVPPEIERTISQKQLDPFYSIKLDNIPGVLRERINIL